MMVSPSTTRSTRAVRVVGAASSRPSLRSPTRSAPPPASSTTTTAAARRVSRRMVRRRYGARATARTPRCTPRLGDRDLGREVDVLDRVEQADALVHRTLEGLAARDEAGASRAL